MRSSLWINHHIIRKVHIPINGRDAEVRNGLKPQTEIHRFTQGCGDQCDLVETEHFSHVDAVEHKLLAVPAVLEVRMCAEGSEVELI